MPLTHLGQLEPTMEQQIALQRALLKLIREDEEMRKQATKKPAGEPTREPALERGLGAGSMPPRGDAAAKAREIYEGRKGEEKPPWAVTFDWAGAREQALARQLRGAEPTPGYISGEERVRMATEAREEREVELGAEADALYDAVQGLSKSDQDFVLSKVVGKEEAAGAISIDMDPTQRALMEEELRERDVAWDPTEPIGPQAVAVRGAKDPLMQTLIDKHYIRLNEDGSYSWMLPEEVKKPMTRDTHVEDGWLYEDILYEDGTSTHEIIGRAPAEEVAAPTISEAVALEKLGIAKEEHAERFRSQAIDIMGDMPRVGIDTITVEGEEVIATAEHANAWIEGVMLLTAFLSGEAGEVPPEGELTMEDVKSMYEGRPDLISDVQQSLGVPVTGIWDEETEFAFGTYGDVLLAGEPTGEGEVKPRFERQKKFWGEWVKGWGKMFLKGAEVKEISEWLRKRKAAGTEGEGAW